MRFKNGWEEKKYIKLDYLIMVKYYKAINQVFQNTMIKLIFILVGEVYNWLHNIHYKYIL